jgi:hypothetical protein
MAEMLVAELPISLGIQQERLLVDALSIECRDRQVLAAD